MRATSDLHNGASSGQHGVCDQDPVLGRELLGQLVEVAAGLGGGLNRMGDSSGMGEDGNSEWTKAGKERKRDDVYVCVRVCMCVRVRHIK